MKQTAVEWLIEQCPRIETIVAYNILEQAKAMEKKAIIDAALELNPGNIPPKLVKELAEQYYNETYNK
jgi:hypothetical protein